MIDFYLTTNTLLNMKVARFSYSDLSGLLSSLADKELKYDEFGNVDPCVMFTLGNNLSDSDAVCEWAARLCYNSSAKFGSVSTFISGLMKAGHYDVIEHAAMEILAQNLDIHDPKYSGDFIKVIAAFPYLKYKFVQGVGTFFSANLRVWRQMVYEIEKLPDSFKFLGGNNDRVKAIMFLTAGGVFKELFDDSPFSDKFEEYEAYSSLQYGKYNAQQEEVAPVTTESGAKVSLLSWMKSDLPGMSHATFQIDNVSRATTHQHVRHRLLSHSEASFRYIDVRDANHILPPNLTEEQSQMFDDSVSISKTNYAAMRLSGVKKEDARAILPLCTATRIISSAYIDGWEHYIKLRDDKAAQYEIRLVAQAIKQQLQEINLL